MGGWWFELQKKCQDNVPWHEYQWNIYVSYRKLNQFTRPFAFPITFCCGAVQYIDMEENYFITVYMDIHYWKVVEE